MVLRHGLQPEMAQGPDREFADWWHIDLRSLISSLGAQFIIEANLPGLVFRDPPPPGMRRPSRMVNLTAVPSRWSSIPTTIFPARSSKVSITKQSIFWTLRFLATAILADSH